MNKHMLTTNSPQRLESFLNLVTLFDPEGSDKWIKGGRVIGYRIRPHGVTVKRLNKNRKVTEFTYPLVGRG